MLYLNSAINPILYNLMSSKFRDGFLLVCHMKKKSELKTHRKGGRDRLGTFRTTSTSCTTSSSVSRQSTLKNTLYKKCNLDRSHSVVEHPSLISKSLDLNSRITQSDLKKLRLKTNISVDSDPKIKLRDQKDDIIIEEEANSIIDSENSNISNANNLKRTKSLLRVFKPFKIRRQNSEPVQQKPLILANDQKIDSRIDVLHNTKETKLPSKQRVISNAGSKSGYIKKTISSEDLSEQINSVPENQEIVEGKEKCKKETNDKRNRPGVSSILVKQRSLDSSGYSANYSLRRSVILKSAKNISYDERELNKLKGSPESFV